MRTTLWISLAVLVGSTLRADTVSHTGTLASPEDTAEFVVALPVAGILGLQTYGFGGGTNAAGNVIPAGGFDPFVGVFVGTGAAASFIDGTSDILPTYTSHLGCPPAGMVDIGGIICGDINMSLLLSPGTYTVLLSDAAYLPNAVFGGTGTLGDGFTDLTGGAFQTCNVTDVTTCVTDTANWALDITTPAPEPRGIVLLIMLGLMLLRICRQPAQRFPRRLTP